MNKKFTLQSFLLAFAFLSVMALSGKAQCIPDTSMGQGFTKVLDDACIGQAYEDTIHFALADSIEIQAPFGIIRRPLDSLQVDALNYLPTGLNWECVNPTCKFYPTPGSLTYGCIRVFGTPTASSTMDSVEIEMTASIQGMQGAVNRTIRRNVSLIIGPFAGWDYLTAGNTANLWSNNYNASSYSWDLGDGNSSTQNFVVHNYAAPGDYIVCLTVTDACGTTTSCDTIMICGPLTADFSFVVSGDTVFFTDQSSGSLERWRWNFGQFGPGNFSQLQNPFHVYNQPGDYYVCLDVTDSCGVEETFCDTVTILPVGIESALGGGITIAPNPMGSQVRISGIDDATFISLLDLQGKAILRKDLDGSVSELLIDGLEGLSEGVYFIRLESEAGVEVHKLMKQGNR